MDIFRVSDQVEANEKERDFFYELLHPELKKLELTVTKIRSTVADWKENCECKKSDMVSYSLHDHGTQCPAADYMGASHPQFITVESTAGHVVSVSGYWLQKVKNQK